MRHPVVMQYVITMLTDLTQHSCCSDKNSSVRDDTGDDISQVVINGPNLGLRPEEKLGRGTALRY